MYIQQLYTGCLSEAAYFIESNGEAAIIDPIRDTEEYFRLAKEHNATIKYIFETHFHADFVSGHIDLSKETGAPIVYGPNTKANFPFHLAKDGEVFKIGNITFEVIHTPGHTLESTCYLLKDEQGKLVTILSLAHNVTERQKAEEQKEFEQREPGEEVVENEYLDKQAEVFSM